MTTVSKLAKQLSISTLDLFRNCSAARYRSKHVIPSASFSFVAGFVSSQKCTLSNTSLVPVTFYLHMAEDGREPAVRSRSPSPTGRSGSAAIAASVAPVAAKEFDINPSSGLLAPQSNIEISVELCANSVRKYNTALCVDVEAVQDSLLVLPATARLTFLYIFSS